MSENTGQGPVSRKSIAELIERYDQPGPRYTSYPTAVEFHEGFRAAQYEDHLAEAAKHEVPQPPSLSEVVEAQLKLVRK